LIIAFTGYKRVGKDTCCSFISTHYNFEHIKISKKLKDVCKILFSMTDDDFEYNKETINETWNITPRKIMQFVGTEMFQYKIQELLPDINKQFWIKSFENEYLKNNDRNYVISDLRFLHEYEILKKYGVIVIKIENERVPIDSNVHISDKEYLQIPYDYVIKNDGRLSNLYKKMDSIISHIFHKTNKNK